MVRQNRKLVNERDNQTGQELNNSRSTDEEEILEIDETVENKNNSSSKRGRLIIPNVKADFIYDSPFTRGQSNSQIKKMADNNMSEIRNSEVDGVKSVVSNNELITKKPGQVEREKRKGDVTEEKSKLTAKRAKLTEIQEEEKPPDKLNESTLNKIIESFAGNRDETVTTPVKFDSGDETDESEQQMPSDVSTSEEETPQAKQRSNKKSKRKPKMKIKHKSVKKRKMDKEMEKRNRAVDDQTIENNPRVQQLMKQMQDMAEQIKKFQGESNVDYTSMMKPINPNKSPSDTTLYMPAVRRLDKDFSPKQAVERVLRNQSIGDQESKENEQVLNRINSFLTNIRLDAAMTNGGKDKQPEPRESTVYNREVSQPSTSSGITDQNRHQVMTAKGAIDNAIIEAERYKAAIQAPPQGNDPDYLKQMRMNDDDDDFFHIICHIDESLKAKIRKGEFVELEKLLKKPEMLNFKNEGKMELVYRNGESYFVPATDKSVKVDGIRKWEQAFRTYAAIYCEANPTRSVEILQYIDVINGAAKTFTWENVARYDFIFRHLQAAKPFRSWAKTYTQMWNITLNEPKRYTGYDYAGSQNSNQNSQSHRSSHKKSGEQACWKFNKGNCSYGKKCKFEHKCSYCGSSNHGYVNCSCKTGGGRSSEHRNKRSGENTKEERKTD